MTDRSRSDDGIFGVLDFRTKRRLLNGILNLLTLLGVLAIVLPLVWVLSSALRPNPELYTRPAPYIPQEFTLVQFERLFQPGYVDFVTYYTNSLVVSAGVVFTTTVISTFGGYGLTRLDIPFKRTFARVILFGYMFPPILLAIPMFIFWRRLGLINSYVGLTLAITATSLPFCLWLMWKFFQTVPVSLEESARMSGASRFRAFYEIALPIAKPGIIAVALFSFSIAWNSYTIPKIIMPDSEKWVLTVGIDTLTLADQVLWGEIMAASVLAIVPPILFVVMLQKYFLQGFRVTGMN